MPSPSFDTGTTGPRPRRLAAALGASAVLHVVLALLLAFDIVGQGLGFGLGFGPGFGIGAGGGVGLGQAKRREIFSLQDLPEPVPPRDPAADEAMKELLKPSKPQLAAIPQQQVARPTSPVVHFSRPSKPIGAGVDLGARFSSSGAGSGGFGIGGGGGGINLGTSFGRYVGSLRKVGLDVALVVDSTGSMQNVIEEMRRRLDALTVTMQRLVPTARIGAVAFRDRGDQKIATAPRQSEDFVVKWTDLTFNGRKVKTFLGGIVAEGGGDWEEAVKEGLETAMRQLKWRPDAKKVIIIVGSSPPHAADIGTIRTLVSDWRSRGGVVSTIDVSRLLHEEHERKLHRWLYGEELQEVTPLPDFYATLRDSFGDIAQQGGGEMVAIGEEGTLVRHLLALTFGPKWERDVSKISRGL
jgi:hypothetical protein